jgi:hypothetical protein
VPGKLLYTRPCPAIREVVMQTKEAPCICIFRGYVGYMEPVINLEETIGKTVGRPRVPDPLDVRFSTKANARAWRTISPVKPVRSGVYRFNSHEEADEWTWKMLTSR